MKATITGSQGFIGSALTKSLILKGWDIYTYLRPDVSHVFWFGSPSSVVQYDKDMDHSFRTTIDGFIDTISYCKRHGIKLIYPSSATVQNKNTPYAHAKACLEEIQQAYDSQVLGLRIFAGYGPGEGHKRDYASIVYQFCKGMRFGQRPVIFGDGKQTRDFVYIDDIVETIISQMDNVGIVDVGTGADTSFMRIVDLINLILRTDLKPVFVDKPPKYIENTKCSHPLKVFTPIEIGVRRICDSLI